MLVRLTSQEDANESVALNVCGIALLQKDVGLVNQQHRLPHGGQLQYLIELCLQRRRICAQLPCADHVQWRFEMLRDGLRGEGLVSAAIDAATHLASTWPAVECHHDALPFALDDIGNQAITKHASVHVDQTLHDRAILWRNDEVVEGVAAPPNWS